MAKIDDLFRMLADRGGSDLHLIAGQRPSMRLHGELERIDGQGALEDGALRELLYEITPAPKRAQFEETGDVDFGHEIPGLARFRANLFNQKYGCAAVFRKIPSQVLTADELGLPVGELNCEPNVFVVGTDDGPGVARAWVERTPEVFEQRYSGATAPPSATTSSPESSATVGSPLRA